MVLKIKIGIDGVSYSCEDYPILAVAMHWQDFFHLLFFGTINCQFNVRLKCASKQFVTLDILGEDSSNRRRRVCKTARDILVESLP
jgi:hypothetical protein